MAEKLILKTSAKDNASMEYRFQLVFYVFQEDGVYIAYCPSLDMSTSGKNFNEAVGNFYERFQLHVECCMEYGTLYDDLIAHGWKLRKKNIFPPTFSALMKKPEMKKLLGSNLSFERIVTPWKIQCKLPPKTKRFCPLVLK